MMTFAESNRYMRLDGERPTPRDRWLAFYRLWRIAHRHKKAADYSGDAEMCFKWLFGWTRWVKLLSGGDDPLKVQRMMPVFLRRERVERARRKREEKEQRQARRLLDAIMRSVEETA